MKKDNDLETLYLKIGNNVKRARRDKNISQLDLAITLGYKSSSTISNAEIYYQKKYHFNLEQLHRISKILNISLIELIK